jgi:L-cysteine desulfidase
MENKRWDEYIDIIKREAVPAMGCTEPIAIAYAAAKAGEVLEEEPESIEVYASNSILKNAMGVGVPGTGMIGIPIAAAVGSIGGKSDYKLEVLKDLTKEQVAKAKSIVNSGKVQVKLKENITYIYIEVILRNKDKHSRVVIEKSHLNITLVELNGQVLFKKDETQNDSEAYLLRDKEILSIEEIYDFVVNVPYEEIKFIRENARLNEYISREGLENDYGHKVGKVFNKYINYNLLKNDIMIETILKTAAASDARMDGCSLSVLSSCGSGNQGILLSIPVITMGQELEKDEETITRALTMSNLMSIYMHSYLGRLSALCGAVLAGASVSTALTFLLGGNEKHIKQSIQNVYGNIMGMVCDGAKNSCALKISTCVFAAITGAILAMEDISITDKEGIVESDADNTIKNACNIGSVAMKETNDMILDIMLNKKK